MLRSVILILSIGFLIGCTAPTTTDVSDKISDSKDVLVKLSDKERQVYLDSVCKPASCEKNMAILKEWDAMGKACVTRAILPCFPNACDKDGVYCRKDCVTQKDCWPGTNCSSATSTCVPVGYICKDAFTVQSTDGSESSCAPYRCLGGGCQSTCGAPADCASGYSCCSGACRKGGC